MTAELRGRERYAIGFRWFAGSRALAYLGSSAVAVLIPIIAVSAPNTSNFQVSLVLAAGTAATLIAPFFLTSFGERVSHRTGIVLADLVRAVALAILGALLILTGNHWWSVLAVAAVIGLAGFISDVCGFRAVPDLVPDELLDGANGLLESLRRAAILIGPAVAGLLFSALGPPPSIGATAIVYLSACVVGFVGLTMWRSVNGGAENPDEPPQPDRSKLPVLSGIARILRTPELRVVVLTSCIYNAFGSIGAVLAPLFAIRELGLSAWQFGLASGVAAVGGMLSGLIANRLTIRFGRRRTMAGAILLAAAAEAIIVLAPAGSPIVGTVLIGASYLVADAAVTVFIVINAGVRQRATPPELRGRVGSAYILISRGAAPLVTLLAAPLIAAYGIRVAVLVVAAGFAVAGLFFAAFGGRLQTEGPPILPVATAESGGQQDL